MPGGGGPIGQPTGGTPSPLADPLGPTGNVASGKLFDEKIALDSRYQFNGSKEQGVAWRERTRGYLISKAPALYKLLVWAEEHDRAVVTVEGLRAALRGRICDEDASLLNLAVRGFLGACVSSTAETVHRSAERMNGLESWRRLCRHIDWGTSIHLDELRSAVRQIVLKPMRRLEDVAVGVI